MSTITLGAVISLVAALCSLLGILFVGDRIKIKNNVVSALLGSAAGIMLSVTCFSLLVPGYADGGTVIASIGLMLGAAVVFILDKMIPHEHRNADESDFLANTSAMKWIFCACVIHNIPEGMAVGIGYARGGLSQGLPLAAGIGFQNILEGIVVALALKNIGISIPRIVLVLLLTTIVEPIMAIVSSSAVVFIPQLTAFLLSFTAGAMLFVISSEMVPESHRQGNERFATFGIIVGFVIMMIINTVL